MFHPYHDSPLRLFSTDDGRILFIGTAHATNPGQAAPPRRPITDGEPFPPGGLRIQVYPLDDL